LLHAVAVEFVELFAPPRCVACDEPCAQSPSFCRACIAQLERCEPAEREGVFAPFVQLGPLVTAVHRAKFGARVEPARAMGLLLREALGPSLDEIDVVVPVPLHRSRLRARTFNQAAELCRALGKPLSFAALVRVRPTEPQAKLDRQARARNVDGAFALRSTKRIRGKRVLLVDDVVTTGSTLDAARRALLDGEPAFVRCAAVARALLWSERDADAR
jgi:ComF family protein